MAWNEYGIKLLVMVAVLLGCYLIVVAIRKISKRILRAIPPGSMAKTRSLVSLGTSLFSFTLYFAAIGFILKGFGISLTAYLASASIIGLAVGFGSQGLVQDIVTGLTLIFSDLIDVGDMVEISGQTGLVKEIGVRFTKIVNHLKAEVNIPNRTISSVIKYPMGCVRYTLDITVNRDAAAAGNIIATVGPMITGAYEQYMGIFMEKPKVDGPRRTAGGKNYLRVECRIWPNRGDVLEKNLKPEIVAALKGIDPDYTDWMVALNYEIDSIQISAAQPVTNKI